MAFPRFCASSSRLALAAAVVLTRKGCSNWIFLELLEPLGFPKAEPDDGLAIGRLLLSDVAGP